MQTCTYFACEGRFLLLGCLFGSLIGFHAFIRNQTLIFSDKFEA